MIRGISDLTVWRRSLSLKPSNLVPVVEEIAVPAPSEASPKNHPDEESVGGDVGRQRPSVTASEGSASDSGSEETTSDSGESD